MAEEKKIVDLAIEATPQIDRTPTEQVVVAEQAPQDVPAVEQAPTPLPTPAIEDIDPYTGKKWKEIALEERRKKDEIFEKLPSMIEEKLSKVNQPATPSYTYEQLEVYKNQHMDDPNIVAWSVGEQRKIQAVEQKKLIEEVVGSRERVTKEEGVRQKSLEYVQKEYPMAFRKDAEGNPVAWDENHPITQTIRTLMQNPVISSTPEGLAAAADIAYGRFAKSNTPALQQKVEQAKADIKQAQKASLTEGSGRRTTVSVQPHTAAIEQARKTGSMKDAEAAIGAILRRQGILTD